MSWKFRLNRMCKAVTVLDLRTDAETRKARCEKYERKHKTHGKPAVFAVN
ncbi:hypothetical protein [Stenotrophomonas phage c9-N]|uniref:Uncharacterized protein n=1 Tax=Stenotrophomonas phage vB_SmeS_BUCT700 TaxID=2924895 RepID=A0AAE9GD00_9CAUD|nr:hypothetical protein [Stenotrophomonas phage vB_SmeS_BUCT700]UNY50315.1 hypothetical protein [Stenotrophomonas phage vB_SmeS_BUCT703]WKC56440.1 hypothetical protein [Stenotrophomonas phage c9-N]